MSGVFYSESGVYPVAALKRGYTWQAGPLQYVTHDAAVHVVFAVCFVIALAFTAGWLTNVVKWLLLPALVTVHARVWPVSTGGDNVLHAHALYATLLPIGAKLSVDDWWHRRRRGAASEAVAIRTAAYPLLLLQLAVIYWFNALSKVGPSWQEGRAISEALHVVSSVKACGAWAAQLPQPLLRALTHGTIAVEAVLPFLILSPWKRRYTHAIAAGLMLTLHGGIFLTMDVGIFSPAMLTFLPLLWHPVEERGRLLARPRMMVRLEAFAVAALIYLMCVRLSRDLEQWAGRPRLPVPESVDLFSRVLGLRQPWMMFSPEPRRRDFVVVTDAVTLKGKHFDPWNLAAMGELDPITALRPSLGRDEAFSVFEYHLASEPDSKLLPFFSRWVLSRRRDGDAVERFDSWMLFISTLGDEVVNEKALDGRVGVLRLPLTDALPVARFDSRGVWAPERSVDGKIAPEGTHSLTPVSASMSAGCPHLTLDLGAPKILRGAFVQADAAGQFTLDGSLDGVGFHLLAEVPESAGRHLMSRVIALPGDAARFIRIRPRVAGAFQNTLSEVAVFERAVSLPALPTRPSETFIAALERPGVVALVSGSNQPDPACPAEQPRLR